MNVSSCLPSRIWVNWIVFVKANWQDPHLHTQSTNHSAIPTDSWHNRTRLLAAHQRKLSEKNSKPGEDWYVWHPQEANANLQLCHFSPHRHPKCCSCEVMSVVMVTVCEPGIARPLTSLFPPSPARSLLPSLPRRLPTRSFSPSPHMPGNQSLKQMWSDCRNESSSQQPYNCAREQMRLQRRKGGHACGRFGGGWMCLFKNHHHFIAMRRLQEGAYLSLWRIMLKRLWQAETVAE